MQVTFIEALDQLMPGFDPEIGKLAQRVLINPRKIDYHTGVFASKVICICMFVRLAFWGFALIFVGVVYRSLRQRMGNQSPLSLLMLRPRNTKILWR